MKIPLQAHRLCALLSDEGYEGRIVGGYVRDRLQNITAHEIDMATTAEPEKIISLCEHYKLKAIPTGIKHGTVTVIIDGSPIEVTTLRKDVQCYGRHATVLFTNDWFEDAKRRDFTINAMYLDAHGKLYDFFDGLHHLTECLVSFIGNAEERIHEDYLRLMRYFRFIGYFDRLNLDEKSLEAAVKLSDKLVKVSAERIKSELLKILCTREPRIPLKLMIENNILHKIGLPIHDVNVDAFFFCDDPLINVAALFKASNVSDISFLKALKFSKLQQKLIGQSLQQDFTNHFNDIIYGLLSKRDILPEMHNLMQNIGQNECIELFKVHLVMHMKSFSACDPKQLWQSCNRLLSQIELKKFPLNGQAIMELGYKNQEIKEKLMLAKKLWIDSNCTLSNTELLSAIQEL